MADKLAQYEKHARKYGTEGILEAAADNGMDFDTLVALQEKVWVIENERGAAASRYFKPKTHRAGAAEKQIKKLLGIEDEQEAA